MAGCIPPRLALAWATALILAALPSVAQRTRPHKTQPQPCPLDSKPAAGCHRGLWSAALCECQCIPPFCRDSLDGLCLSAGHCDAKKNPWEDCNVGADCPWWSDRLNEATCVTGREVPSGVWEVHVSEEDCCTVHHPYSSDCYSGEEKNEEEESEELPRVIIPAVNNEVIPLRFTVSGLPSGVEVNTRDLKDVMAMVLRSVLTNLAETQQDLKLNVTKIEENIQFNETHRNVTGGGDDKLEIFYDISLRGRADTQLGPVVIAGLRDSRSQLVEYLEHYEATQDFGHGIDFYWCIQDNTTGDGNGNDKEEPLEVAGVCSFIEETVSANLRLAHLPKELDVERLVHHMVSVFKDLLQEIDRLDIIDIKTEVANATSIGEGNHTADVFFDIRLIQKNDVGGFFGQAISDKLLGSINVILHQMQYYTDMQTNLTLDWFITDEGSYATHPRQSPTTPMAKRQIMFRVLVIVTLVMACSLLIYGSVRYMVVARKRQAEFENERNMMSYLETGQGYIKQKNGHRPRYQPPEGYRVALRRKPREPKRGYHSYFDSDPERKPMSYSEHSSDNPREPRRRPKSHSGRSSDNPREPKRRPKSHSEHSSDKPREPKRRHSKSHSAHSSDKPSESKRRSKSHSEDSVEDNYRRRLKNYRKELNDQAHDVASECELPELD